MADSRRIVELRDFVDCGMIVMVIQIKSYDISWLERLVLMPSFFILLRNVLGWRLSILAAPLGPSTTPPVCSRTARICCRSTSSREEELLGPFAVMG